MKYAQLADKRARVYVLVSTWLVVWGVWHVYFVEAVFPNAILWLEYYAANYEFGFVRRGLAGELIRRLPGDHFFAGAYTILWMSITVWLIALAVVMWLVLSTGTRSERRIMLALLVPVLPFAFSYAIYNPHPELFGMTALVAFSISLTRVHTPRTRVVLGTLYGIAMAVLALVHEAIPLEFALGAVLAIVVLSKDATPAARRICTVLAIGPGIVSVLLLAVVGRRDIADQLCSHVPHGMVENPWAVATTPQRVLDYMLGRVESRADYHDWVCQYVTPGFNLDWITSAKLVIMVGFPALFGAFLLGLLFFVATTWMIRYVSAVPVRTFLAELRGNLVLPALASALLVPLFITAVDWTRWWVMITLDVAIVYILYAINRPEIEQPPSRRNVLVFVCVVLALAVIPTGSANNIGG
ncbi:hypothetical protein H7H78_14900 [Mycobacterium shinjukuense]|uniref:Uncharacterized protein n=1 Tax=Mycobacterium shinjukuense TaxID=398694 RepID=A0A7I7MNH0_9MYCO|nr:hypothetical protein [Mycobacterium shinjukuense]BBX73804.1 hypothetical protein MSHI_17100 [Mycobacterium shinjukuense]